MSPVITSILLYLLPALLLGYASTYVLASNCKSVLHRLASALLLCAHLWFVGEFVITILPSSYTLPIKTYITLPVLCFGTILCTIFVLTLSKRKPEPIHWLITAAPLLLLYVPISIGQLTLFTIGESGIWKIPIPRRPYYVMVTLLNLYALYQLYVLWQARQKVPRGEKRRADLLLLICGTVASSVSIIAIIAVQPALFVAYDGIPNLIPLGLLFLAGSFLYVVTTSPVFSDYRHIYKEWFRLSSVASLVLDDRGSIVEINPAFEKMSGYTQAGIGGQSFFSLFEVKLSELGDFNQPCPAKEVTMRLANGESRSVFVESERVMIGNDVCHFLMIHDISEQQREVQRMKYLAYHDNLTGLANRRLFQESFAAMTEEASQNDQLLACMVVDLDDFKKVNDTMGHHAGDMLLKVIAERLTYCVRRNDLVVRLGGDEFVILLIADDTETVTSVTNRIMEHLNRPIAMVSIHGSYLQASALASILIMVSIRSSCCKKQTKRCMSANETEKTNICFILPSWKNCIEDRPPNKKRGLPNKRKTAWYK